MKKTRSALATFLLLLMTGSVLMMASPAPIYGQGTEAFFTSPVSPDPAGNQTDCYFRKRFTLANPEEGELLVAATGPFRIHVNGRQVLIGDASEAGLSINVTEFLYPGINLIAAEVKPMLGSQDACLSMRFRVKEKGEVRWRAMNVDSSWKTHRTHFEGWQKHSFRELSWLPATPAPVAAPQAIAAAPSSNEPRGNGDSGEITPLSTQAITPASLEVATTGAAEPKTDTAVVPAGRQLEAETKAEENRVASRGLLGILRRRDKQDAASESSVASHADGSAQAVSDRALENVAAAGAASHSDSASYLAGNSIPIVRNEASQPADRAAIPVVPSVRSADQRTWVSPSVSSEAMRAAVDRGETSQPSHTISSRAVEVATTAPPTSQAPEPGPEVVESVEQTFEISDEFRVTPVMTGEETGSVIAMVFNEFGQLILSQEGGPLLIADPSIPYGQPRVAILCDQVESCQGILCVNGDVYVTGKGPSGLGLYCLERLDPNSTTMTVKSMLVRFKGELGEHGPHGLSLGPDGKIYCVVGNASGVSGQNIPGPYQHPYETDLRPRYEDPSGHANGIRAPGGTVIRVNLDGSNTEIVAGGLRNAYDLTFNQDGELFIHDSDMESDLGLPWYRPTALYHVSEGAELGWRSGWAKFPDYYLDSAAPIAKTGRGSPSGAVSYEHLQFPLRYHGALFLADWSEGRIIAAQLQREGNSYVCKTEDFLKGKPLNVTDLDVGEDGALYFATGGRGTSGGIYKVSWTGAVPASVIQFEDDLTRLLRHPQPGSAWARQNMASLVALQKQDWKQELSLVVLETTNSDAIRSRALSIMYLFGYLNDPEWLAPLTEDHSEPLRARIAELGGSLPGWNELVLKLIEDPSPFVRRKAAEACLASRIDVPVPVLTKLLADEDRVLAATATRLLERLPSAQWKETILQSDLPHLALVGSVALLRAEPTKSNAHDVLAKCSQLLMGYLSDRDFMDLLRVSQLALTRAQLQPSEVGEYAGQMLAEFPTQNELLNRELIRILAYLKSTSDSGRYVEYLQNSEDSPQTKILVAMYLASLANELDDDTRLAVISFLSDSVHLNSGGSYQHYLARCIRETTDQLSEEALVRVIENGDAWPYALVPTFYRLNEKSMAELTPQLCVLDQKLKANQSRDVVAQARLGIIALLAGGNTEEGYQYLRDSWMAEADRRNDLIIGIAQNPSPENWTYMIASLPLLDDMTAQEVLSAIKTVKLRPVAAKHYRDVLELGYRLGKSGADDAVSILQLWTSESLTPNATDWKSQLDAWSEWFSSRWPDEQPVAKPNTQSSPQVLQVSRLTEALTDGKLRGDSERGLLVFTKAECSKCHRFGSTGDSSGPDLTSLASRFSKRETLEAIVWPSKVVSDQYRNTLVINDQGVTHVGLKVDNGDGSISLIQSDASRIRLRQNEIVEMKQVEQSTMPSGLLDRLSQQEIADLFAFLYREPEVIANSPAAESQIK